MVPSCRRYLVVCDSKRYLVVILPVLRVSSLVSCLLSFVSCLSSLVSRLAFGIGGRVQTWNILANVTTNERLNGRRYPWLKAPDASGVRFNRYDQGPWGNLIEFFGLTGKEGDEDEAQGGRHRCPRDYLEVGFGRIDRSCPAVSPSSVGMMLASKFLVESLIDLTSLNRKNEALFRAEMHCMHALSQKHR